MNSTVQLSDTEILEAKLVAKLSGRPVHVKGDVFVWHDHLIDRATAIVALLKSNNQVPVSDHVKMQMHENFYRKFKQFEETEDLVFNDIDKDPPASARIWFNFVCRKIKTTQDILPSEQVKQILLDLHKN